MAYGLWMGSTSTYGVEGSGLDWLCKHHSPKSEVQPYLEIVDIAGVGCSGYMVLFIPPNCLKPSSLPHFHISLSLSQMPFFLGGNAPLSMTFFKGKFFFLSFFLFVSFFIHLFKGC